MSNDESVILFWFTVAGLSGLLVLGAWWLDTAWTVRKFRRRERENLRKISELRAFEYLKRKERPE